ncbi:MAG: GGDEF domain-containing protein [Armatimonadetes bacterium]|nr:GGDEF domain-containing protein [Armatimonadota bacterium]
MLDIHRASPELVAAAPGAQASLHEALASAGSPLDVLEACDRALGADTGYVWAVTGAHQPSEGFVYGSKPADDAELRALLEQMRESLSSDSCLRADGTQVQFVCRWASPGAALGRLRTDGYDQVRLTANGSAYGLLRAVPTDLTGDDMDRRRVQAVLRAAAGYAILSLERLARKQMVDPLTGLWTPEEFELRVGVEVERAQVYPVEFSLVLMEMRMGADRLPGCLTDQELAAVGRVLRQSLRTADSAARMPDGRFALLLPVTSQRSAFIAVSRVLDRLRQDPDLPDDIECRTGVSGWTFEGSSGPELFQQAGAALENARAAGAKGAFVFL